MPRKPKPWYRKDRKAWFVTIDGQRHNLGQDKNKAEKFFYKLMAETQPTIRSDSVVAIVDAFMDWLHDNRAETTYNWYLTYLESFCQTVKSLRVDELQPKHVTKWLKSHSWSNSTKRGAVTCVKRCFSWAVKEGHIERSPVEHVEKPEQGRRETIVTPIEYEQIIAKATDQSFIDLLTFAWESGARPQECYRAEARHFEEKLSRLVFPKEESKGKKRPRIIYLNNVALAVVKRNLHGGHLFLNQDGKPFDKNSVNCRFLRLQRTLGRERMREHGIEESKNANARKRQKENNRLAMKYGKKFCIYQFRHAFTTRLLESGVDPLTVAILLGHANPAILSTTYQHLAFNPGNLLRQLKRA